MAETWTMTELVEEVTRRIQALPRPQNGQIRAVPDDRTVRYYLTIGLLDRPAAMRGRTALYGRKHVAQVVAIKRLQSMGRSLAEIQALWPTLDDPTLARMSGVELTDTTTRKARKEFWKREPAPVFDAPAPPVQPTTATTPPPSRPPAWPQPAPEGGGGAPSRGGGHRAAPAELRIELAPNLSISIALSSDIAVSLADVAAIRAAAAPLIAELASRQLGVHAEESEQGADV